MYSQTHLPGFNHPKNILRRIQVIMLIIMKFSPSSIFLTFRFEYPPQQSLLKNPQSVFLPKLRDQLSHPCSTTGKIPV
jgi:hypothetical protein